MVASRALIPNRALFIGKLAGTVSTYPGTDAAIANTTEAKTPNPNTTEEIKPLIFVIMNTLLIRKL